MFIQTSEGLLTLEEINSIQPFITSSIKYDVKINNETAKRIKTSNGIELTVSPNQFFRIVDGYDYEFKRAYELKIGDSLAVSLGDHPTSLGYVELETLEGTNEPKFLTNELAYFIGWFLKRKNLYNENDIALGKEFYENLFKKTCENIFESDMLDEWIYLNILRGTCFTYCLRTSKVSVILSFLKGFFGYIPNETVKIEEEYSYFESLNILCRSVGIWCLRGDEKVTHWNGMILDEIVSIEDVFGYETMYLRNDIFYKINNIISK